jgi:hypothetical protein
MAEDSPVPGPALSPGLLIPTGQGSGNTTDRGNALTAPGSEPAAAYPPDHGVPVLGYDAGHRDGGIEHAPGGGPVEASSESPWVNVEGRRWT